MILCRRVDSSLSTAVVSTSCVDDPGTTHDGLLRVTEVTLLSARLMTAPALGGGFGCHVLQCNTHKRAQARGAGESEALILTKVNRASRCTEDFTRLPRYRRRWPVFTLPSRPAGVRTGRRSRRFLR